MRDYSEIKITIDILVNCCYFNEDESNEDEGDKVYNKQIGNNCRLYYNPNPKLKGEQWFISYEWRDDIRMLIWRQPENLYELALLFFALSNEKLTIDNIDKYLE